MYTDVSSVWFCLCRWFEENVGALAVKLTPEDLKELEEAFPHGKVRGGGAWNCSKLNAMLCC